MTALHWAVQRDDLEMVKALLGAGADFRVVNRTGVRPVYLATVNGSASVIDVLLGAGEDANAVLTAEGETVLMLTAQTGNPAAVKLLLDHGADPNVQQLHGQTALMWAARSHTDAVKLLVDRARTLRSLSPQPRGRSPAPAGSRRCCSPPAKITSTRPRTARQWRRHQSRADSTTRC
jgi:ankyrin repeat protein